MAQLVFYLFSCFHILICFSNVSKSYSFEKILDPGRTSMTDLDSSLETLLHMRYVEASLLDCTDCFGKRDGKRAGVSSRLTRQKDFLPRMTIPKAHAND